tara:strand:+ start:504 stop:929 length:426 start_codon:yes stop_codon:yes gene_type:complete
MGEMLDVERLWRGWNRSPFYEFLQMELKEWDQKKGTAKFHVPFKSRYERASQKGGYHGGVLASIIDISGDFALAIKCNRLGFPTIDLRVDYLRLATSDDLTVYASTIKAGRRIGVADIEVFDVNKRLCTAGRGTYAIMDTN